MKAGKALPGMKVRLTGNFLRSTGQIAGGEGQKRWNIIECDCNLCKSALYCAVNEPHLCQSYPTGYEDIPEAERPKYRHFNVANLETCR